MSSNRFSAKPYLFVFFCIVFLDAIFSSPLSSHCGGPFIHYALAQVIPPNTNPNFTPGADIAVLEDSGMYSVAWASTISDGEGAGGANGGDQSLEFKLVPQDPSLFSRQPTIDSSGVLSFTPAPDAYGSTQVSVTLHDDGTSQCVVGGNNNACPSGCSPSDCAKSVTYYFQININPVNDCPRFTVRGDQTINEDNGQAIVTGFAYSVSQGATNEAQQTLAWSVTNNNNALFSQQPYIRWSLASPSVGDLIYTPAADAFGSALVTVVTRDNGGQASGGCDQSTTQTFTITVNAVNDKPSFQMGTNPVGVDEDSGPATFASWASSISAGPTNENTQNLAFNLQFVDSSVASLFTTQPAIDAATGTLTFTTAPNANTFGRKVQMYIQLKDNGGSSPLDVSCTIPDCPILTININPINDAPNFAPGGDILVWEDLGQMTIPPVPPVYTDGNAWATQISVGATNEGVGVGLEGQEPKFVVSNTNTGLFDVQPAIDSRGTLTFQLKKDAFGVASVTATIQDTGNPAKTGNTATFTITVLEVNDQPSFDIIHSNPMVIQEDAGLQDIAVWATNIVRGPDNEKNQIAQFYLEPEDPSFFSVQPTVQLTDSGTGRLQFQVTPNRWGTQKVRVVWKDNGGVERKGVDLMEKTLIITVNEVNDVPSFDLKETTITVIENNDPLGYSRGAFAFNITAGALEDSPKTSVLQGQKVRFLVTVNNEFLFSELPKISPEGTLTFTQEKDQFGDAIATVIAEDDFLPSEKSHARTFTIHILARNNAPSFTLGPDIVGRQVSECLTAGACTRTFAAYAKDISPGPAVNEGSQRVTFQTSVAPQFQSLFTTLPKVDAESGHLTFTLKQFASTEVGNPITVTVIGKDDGGTTNGGVDTTIKTFKLEIQPLDNPPEFTPGPDVSVNEDTGLKQILSWAKNIKKTSTDSSTSNLVFRMMVGDPTLFSQQPAISVDTANTGTLSFIPATNKFGTSLVQVTLDNTEINQNSDQFTIRITVNPVNDAPTFQSGGDVSVTESSGSYVRAWANDISAGPYENSQILTFTVSCDDTQFFAVAPIINSVGELRFTLTDAKHGVTSCLVVLKDNGGTLNGGIDNTQQRFTLTIHSKNEAPSFVLGPDITVLENSGDHQAPNWATAMQAGAGDGQQLLTFVLSVDNSQLFSVQPKINSVTGLLTFTTKEFENGVATISVYLMDDGPQTAPHQYKSPTVTFRVIIKPVNSAPSFDTGFNVAVLQNSGVYRQNQWATNVRAGPSNEASQTMKFTLTPDDVSLFDLPPIVDPQTGDLMFSTKTGKSGVTSVRMCLRDNGGKANGGVDETCDSLSISIVPVNQAPNAIFPEVVTVLEDSGKVSLMKFLSAVTGGPNGETQQQITGISTVVTEADKLNFMEAPYISITNYELTFRTKQDYFGEVTVTVTITDNGGTSNGGTNSRTSTFVIRVLSVNDAPSFSSGPTVEVLEDSEPYTALWATNVIPGPANEASQSLLFSLVAAKPNFFAVQPSINSRGFLSFTLAKDASGETEVVCQLKDNGGVENGGKDLSLQSILLIKIIAVNDPPTYTAGPDLKIMEDSGPYIYAAWATNVRAGPDDETVTQRTLRFKVTPADKSFFSVQPQLQMPTGDFSFTVADHKFGTTTIAVILQDFSGEINGGVASSTSRTVTLVVEPVNDAPSFTTKGDLNVLEDAGDQVIKDYIQSVTAGPYETSQSVTFSVTVSDPTKFSSPARIIGKDLLFTTAQDVNGVVTLTFNATDRGDGGIFYKTQSYLITIVPVNDAPIFTIGADVTVAEGSGISTFTTWIPKVAPGPPDESNQLLTSHISVDKSALLATMPLINTVTHSLTVQVVPYAFGTITCTVYFSDNGGTSNGGADTSAKQTFNIKVTAVNDPPTFNPGTPLLAVSNGVTTYSAQWATNVSAGPRETTQSVAFEVFPSNPALFTSLGQPKVSSTGILSFILRVGATGNSTLAITLRDSQNAISSTAYVNLVITSPFGNDVIVLVMNSDYESFSVSNFKSVVASSIGVETDQIVVRSVSRASVRVEFQIIGRAGGKSSEELMQLFVNTATQPNSPIQTQLAILSIELKSANSVGSSQNYQQNTESSTDTSNSNVKYVALAVGLFAGIAIIAIIIYVFVSWRRKRDKRKREQYAAQEMENGAGEMDSPRPRTRGVMVENNHPNGKNPIKPAFMQPRKAPDFTSSYESQPYGYAQGRGKASSASQPYY